MVERTPEDLEACGVVPLERRGVVEARTDSLPRASSGLVASLTPANRLKAPGGNSARKIA